jgi:hypothetical protein
MKYSVSLSLSLSRLRKDDGVPLQDPTPFRSMVGGLQYLTFTRPDLTYVVNHICQFMHQPTDQHLVAAKRILRYVQGSLHHGLTFRPGPLTLTAYTDSNWVGDPMDRHFTMGLIIFLGHNPITWQSKKQPTVSRFSIEAEYRALANCTADLSWVRMVLKDLGIFLRHPPTIWCDNLSALALATNPVFHARTKHVEVDYHLYMRKLPTKIFNFTTYPPMISLRIYLLKLCLLHVFCVFVPNSCLLLGVICLRGDNNRRTA